MTKELLIEVNEMLKDGLRAHPKGAPCLCCCPVACLDCTVADCADRLAGGQDAK